MSPRTHKPKIVNESLRMLNSLVPDQARHFVGPGLDPNCLQRLMTDDTSPQEQGEIKDTYRSVVFSYFGSIPCMLISSCFDSTMS